jgi:hypothetical protein
MSLLSILLIALLVIVSATIGAFAGKGIRFLMNMVQDIKERRRLSRQDNSVYAEIQEDKATAIKRNMHKSPDGKAEVLIENAEVVWVRLVGKERKYPSIHDLFSIEVMDMQTHDELVDLERRLRNVRVSMSDNLFLPKTHHVYHTKRDLGQDLVIYREGDIRISDRMILTIGRQKTGPFKDGLGVIGVLLSFSNLDHAGVFHDWDFQVSAKNPQEQVEVFLDTYNHYLTMEEFEDEAREIAKVQNSLEFYNMVTKDGQISIIGGRVYIRAVPPLILQVEDTEKDLDFEVSARQNINDRIKNAIDARQETHLV